MNQPSSRYVRVAEVISETPDAHSLVLEPVDGEPFDYHAGQFLTVRIPGEDGSARCYSLCSSPHTGEPARITVKRTPGGHGSNWICDNIVAGSTLEVLRPSGTFTPKSLDQDLLLLAAGSGITPVMSILKSCLYAGSGSVTLVYANRDEQSVIFGRELTTLAAEFGDRLTVAHWLESERGLPDHAGLRELVAPCTARAVFLCGPEPFMELATDVMQELGVPRDRLAVEWFHSLSGDPFVDDPPEIDTSASSSTVQVQLDGETRTVTWPRENRLLDVLRADGLDAPFSCREGACSACACMLLEGDVNLANNEILDAQDLADGVILACQATPLTDHVKVTYDV